MVVLKTKLEKHVLKRVSVVFIVMAIADVVLIDGRWPALAGLFIGTFTGLFRFSLASNILSSIISTDEFQRRPAFKLVSRFLLNYILLVVLFACTLLVNKYLFFGSVAGILTIPLVLIINGFTEAFGLTHNNFE